MIVRTPIVDAGSKPQKNQDWLDKKHVDHQCDTFKIDNAMMYCILSKVFMDLDAYVAVKQRKSGLDGFAVFFNAHH